MLPDGFTFTYAWWYLLLLQPVAIFLLQKRKQGRLRKLADVKLLPDS